MKLRQIILIICLIVVSSCQSAPSSNMPTPPITSKNSALPRWKVYETALSKAILHKDDGLCEWEILGKSDNEVYVYTKCKARGPIGTSVYFPGVIHLTGDDEIEAIVLPRDGNEFNNDIRSLFPSYLQDRIFNFRFDDPLAENHIDERLISNGPPLIAISGTPLP